MKMDIAKLSMMVWPMSNKCNPHHFDMTGAYMPEWPGSVCSKCGELILARRIGNSLWFKTEQDWKEFDGQHHR